MRYIDRKRRINNTGPREQVLQEVFKLFFQLAKNRRKGWHLCLYFICFYSEPFTLQSPWNLCRIGLIYNAFTRRDEEKCSQGREQQRLCKTEDNLLGNNPEQTATLE
jgi:hypothetical protein